MFLFSELDAELHILLITSKVSVYFVHLTSWDEQSRTNILFRADASGVPGCSPSTCSGATSPRVTRPLCWAAPFTCFPFPKTTGRRVVLSPPHQGPLSGSSVTTCVPHSHCLGSPPKLASSAPCAGTELRHRLASLLLFILFPLDFALCQLQIPVFLVNKGQSFLELYPLPLSWSFPFLPHSFPVLTTTLWGATITDPDLWCLPLSAWAATLCHFSILDGPCQCSIYWILIFSF